MFLLLILYIDKTVYASVMCVCGVSDSPFLKTDRWVQLVKNINWWETNLQPSALTTLEQYSTVWV